MLVTASLTAVVYGLSEAPVYGWSAGRVLVALVGAVILLLTFLAVEACSSRPLLPLGILSQRTLTAAALLMTAGGVILTGSLFVLSLYCQQVLGYSAIRTGLAITPMSVLLTVGALGCRALIPEFGARRLLVVGLAPRASRPSPARPPS